MWFSFSKNFFQTVCFLVLNFLAYILRSSNQTFLLQVNTLQQTPLLKHHPSWCWGKHTSYSDSLFNLMRYKANTEYIWLLLTPSMYQRQLTVSYFRACYAGKRPNISWSNLTVFSSLLYCMLVLCFFVLELGKIALKRRLCVRIWILSCYKYSRFLRERKIRKGQTDLFKQF